MAAISRIQVANFLTEGFSPGDEWAPLYRGETFRLFGQPTAMQIDNGGGKTSFTEACLYMLTRHRQLKSRVEDKVAPPDKGWTHIRIEFVEKAHYEDILQADLITLNPDDIPGTSYVVGMCWSRNKDANFYSYQGLLENAPCFVQNQNGLVLVANDTFRKSIENIPYARWNRWRNQPEWLDEIRQFTNIEVLLQNVQFQLDGAGDYSAMITKVEARGGEEYDTAFFRQFVAPELLKHVMGAEGDVDELGFEDTILKTLKPAADALLDINGRQLELEHTKNALRKFEPVLEKAREVVSANADYEKEMRSVIQNAAIVNNLVVTSPLPGIPAVHPNARWATEKPIIAVLKHMIINKSYGVLITDEGLAELINIETRRLNEKAGELKLSSVLMDADTISLRADLNRFLGAKDNGNPVQGMSQLIDNKADLKQTGRGGRRYGTKCYELIEALTLVKASANFSSANIAGVPDTLTRAFGVAINELDTNPYRAHIRNQTLVFNKTKAYQKIAQDDYNSYKSQYEVLITQSRETKDNQIAYEVFITRKNEFPTEYWELPLAAHNWASEEAMAKEDARTKHIKLSSERMNSYSVWQKRTAQHAPAHLTEVLGQLIQAQKNAFEADTKIKLKLKEAKEQLRYKRTDLENENRRLSKLKQNLDRLNDLSKCMSTFRNIFGNAIPSELDPQGEINHLQLSKHNNDLNLQNSYTENKTFLDLLPKIRIYGEIFGSTDPASLNPSQDLQRHLHNISIESELIKKTKTLVEILIYFRSKYPGLSPDQWLKNAANQRREFTEERANNVNKIQDLQAELKDLDTLGAADDRVYAKALKVLTENDIAFERLHDLIFKTVQGIRREQCLTLFSASLSAPVIISLEVAAEATRLLEEAKLTVPIFHKHGLEKFVTDGEINEAGKVAYSLWVGRRTRQVTILLNPLLIEKEKEQINEQITQLVKRNNDIGEALIDISEESVAIKIAQDAREAIRIGSERVLAEAEARLGVLSQKTLELENRASKEAQDAISSMIRYQDVGGDFRYKELIEKIIPQLEVNRNEITARLDLLVGQTTEQALRALHMAKDFQRVGGDEALLIAKAEFDKLNVVVESLDTLVNDLQFQIDGELYETENKISKMLTNLNETFSLDKLELETAIHFEQSGFVEFMENAFSTESFLNAELKIARDRLQGIDFERADRYIKVTQLETRSIADRIADAKNNRDKAEENIRTSQENIMQIEAGIALMVPFMESMHEMIVSIRTQFAKVSTFSDDIQRLIKTSYVEDPEIMGYEQIIQLAFLGETPDVSQEIRTAMMNLRQCMMDLDINTNELQKLLGTKQRLYDEYVQRRDDFCNRAKSGYIRGLNQLEVSAISNAKTLEQLMLIQEIQDTIETQITEIETNLNVIRDAMIANKEASINNLAKFARDAKLSLDILERVMRKTPSARFHIEAPVADDHEIERIITELLEQIEDRERAVRESGTVLLNEEIDRKATNYKQLIHDTIYKRIFSARDKDGNQIVPRVYFTHISIRGNNKVPFINRSLSTGQLTALAMMWLIKQAEFAIARAASLYGTRKEQKAALKGAQRIMFFDGLFSNLSNEEYINDAFQGLRGVGENFQLIGLIHNPYYVNNKDIFPVHLVGKKMLANKSDPNKKRVFISVVPWQENNGMLLYTSAFKHNYPTHDK